MKFYIKNNNIYYYNYPIIKGELSPLLGIIYIWFLITNVKYIINFNYLSIFVGIFGIIDSLLHIPKYKLYLFFIINALLHLIFLYPLINYKKYMKPNILNYILSAIGLLIIVLLPYWPYIISKVKAIVFLIFINIFFTYYYYFHYKHSMF